MKSVLCKMVPYASFPYADHVLRLLSVDPNKKAEASDEAAIDLLIAAAQKLKVLVTEMERMDEIKGYIVYSPDEAKPPPE